MPGTPIVPLRKIEGPHTGINGPLGIAVDTDGTIYVANNNSNSITVYAPQASGDAAPIRTIAGPQTGLNSPRRLVLH